MSADGNDYTGSGGVIKVDNDVEIEADPPLPGNLTVYSENVSIKISSIMALKELAEVSPEIANSLVAASREAVSLDAKKYLFGAVATAAVALCMLIGSVAIIIERGLMPGIAFFIVCAAVASIFSAVFTGKSQPLEWTLGPFRSAQTPRDQNNGESAK